MNTSNVLFIFLPLLSICFYLFFYSQLASAIKILEMTVFVSVWLVAWDSEMEGKIEKDDHEQVLD